MLKMYGLAKESAATSAFWDDTWQAQTLSCSAAQVRQQCENDPIWGLIESRIAKDRLFMDGGCGPAQWVRYYRDRGFRTLGIDFAAETIDWVKRNDPRVDVRLGDVRKLPLESGELHVYLSAGVVEHFEEGPEAALAEARRVIAQDGWFLCSVPDASWLRAQVLFRRADAANLVARAGVGVRRVGHLQVEPTPKGWSFFQYCFGESEFRQRLHEAGFRVEGTQGYSLLWGLFEIPGFASAYTRAFARLRKLRRAAPHASASESAPGGASSNGSSMQGIADPELNHRSERPPVGLFKRLLVREDTLLPWMGKPLHFMLERAANMRMYIARPF